MNGGTAYFNGIYAAWSLDPMAAKNFADCQMGILNSTLGYSRARVEEEKKHPGRTYGYGPGPGPTKEEKEEPAVRNRFGIIKNNLE